MRGLVLILACALLAACSSTEPLSKGLAAPMQASSEPQRDPSKKTIASKVLTALAVERVTGRKPDLSRLTQLN